MQRESSQEPFPLRQKLYQHLAPILISAMPGSQSSALQAIDQLHRAVMLQLHSFCERTNRGAHVRRKTLNREQQLVLLGFESGGAGSRFAEVQKTPDLVAELRQGTVIEVFGFLHDIYRNTILS